MAVIWLCYRTPRGKTAVTVRDGDLSAAVARLTRLFAHGLPDHGVWYCEQADH